MKIPNLVRLAGDLLFEDRWVKGLSDELDVADRTIRRWAAGSHDVPLGAHIAIIHLLIRRRDSINRLIEELEKAENDRSNYQSNGEGTSGAIL